MPVAVTFPGNLGQVQTIDALRQVPTYFVDPETLYIVIDAGRTYAFDPGSLAVDDGISVIRPNDRTILQAGRFVYVVDGIAPGRTGDPGGDPTQVGPFVQARTFSYLASVNRIYTTGFATEGDGGGAAYDRYTGTAQLPSIGQNIWWFQAADGSRWQIVDADQHNAASFGALGGESIEAGVILTRAFLAPQVKQIHLGALTHYFVPRIDVPSGKFLVGAGPSVSKLVVVPLPAGQTQTSPRFAVRHLNTIGGGSSGYSLDCSRSGLGRGDPNRTHGVCVLALNNGLVSGTTVDNVEVYNCFGYAFYTAAQAGGTNRVENVVHTRISAYNFQVGIETTGNVVNSYSRDTLSVAAPQDGGALIPTETLYHEYGGIQSFTRYNARGSGTASAGILIFTTDGVDVGSVAYENPDITGNFGSGLFVEGRDGNKVNAFRIEGGQITSSTLGAVFRQGNFVLRSTALTGQDGNGLEIGTGANVDMYTPVIEANRDATGTTAAVAVAIDSPGTIRMYGSGRLQADGPPGSFAINKNAVQFFGEPQFTPLGDPVTPLPGQILRERFFRIPQSSWIVNGTQDLEARIDLSAQQEDRVADIAKAHVLVSFEFTATGEVRNPLVSTSTFWPDTTMARIFIASNQPMTGWVLKARLTEYA